MLVDETTVPLSAADLVREVTSDPVTTARRWTEMGADIRCFGAEFLKQAMEHHLDGLVYDTIKELGWQTQIPPWVLNNLRRRAALSAARYEAHYDAFAGVAAAAPELVERTLLLKGAIIGPLYSSPTYRLMGDFDLLVVREDWDQLMSTLKDLGYEGAEGGFGKDMVKQVGPAWSGLASVTMHCFVLRPAYLDACDLGRLRDVSCLIPRAELLMMNLLTNTFGHAMSWSYATFGGDLQLIRCVDVDVVAERMPELDGNKVWELALRCGLHGEAAIGLWLHRELCGRVPQALEVLLPYADAVASCGSAYAMPDGTIRDWTTTVRERLGHPNRTVMALRELPPGQATPEHLHEIREGLHQTAEPTHRIAARARELLERKFGVRSPAGVAFATEGGASMA
jgi:Uncharacterised nucleotidyltransferase